MLKSFLAVGLLALGCSLAHAQAGDPFVVVDEFFDPNEVSFEGFGWDTAISGSRILVGTRGIGAPFPESLGASIWEEDAQGNYVQVADLLPPGGAVTNSFGVLVELQGDRAVVSEVGSTFTAFAYVHVFERQSSGVWTWQSTAQTALGDGGLYSMDLDGDRVVLGRNELVHVFEPDTNGDWFETATIQAGNVSPFHDFGWSVSVSGDRIAVGAPQALITQGQFGRVDIFELGSQGQWVEVDSLTGDSSDAFGLSLDMEGERMVVGTHGNASGPERGQVFVVERQVSGDWTIVETLSDLGGPSFNALKVESVALSGNRVVASYESRGNYWYTQHEDGNWVYSGDIGTPTGFAGVTKSISLEGDRAVYGTRVGTTAVQAGTVVVFDLEPLSTDTQSLSLLSGGVQSFDLEAGEANAGRIYVLLGSLSGTSPGFMFGGMNVPLVFDGYLLETLNAGAGSPLQNSIGVLGLSGQGSASLLLPPGSPASLAGLVGHHAFASIQLQPLSVEFVSNPKSLLLVQ